MKIVSVDELEIGQVVARALTDETGRILLNRGVTLTETYIRALRAKGYEHLFVNDNEDLDLECDEDLSIALRSFAVQTLRQAYDDIEKDLIILKRASAQDITKVCSTDQVRSLMGPTGPLAGIQDLISQIMDEVLSRNTLAGLTSIKSQSSHLYNHSLDVCVIAIMVGHVVGLPTVRLRQLAAGCILHDIGMLFVSADVEEEIRIRQHTTLGYELLRSPDNADIMAPHVAYEHHEHQDGTGLPRGIKGSNRIKRERTVEGPILTLIGEIAAVANTYDNLISGKKGQQGLTPDAALAKMSRLSGSMLNAEVLAAFKRVIPIYPRGTQVILRGNPYNNYLAVVSKVDPTQFDRPSVVLLRDANRNRVAPLQINLAELPETSIRAAVI